MEGKDGALEILPPRPLGEDAPGRLVLLKAFPELEDDADGTLEVLAVERRKLRSPSSILRKSSRPSIWKSGWRRRMSRRTSRRILL